MVLTIDQQIAGFLYNNRNSEDELDIEMAGYILEAIEEELVYYDPLTDLCHPGKYVDISEMTVTDDPGVH